MKVLVIGSGGREHALVWKLSQSPKVTQIFAAPGNPGIGSIARNISIALDDVEGLLQFALSEKFDLVVVGPELPLSLGIVDRFQSEGIRIFGPSQAAAQMEASKAFSKMIMKEAQIPTPSCTVVQNKNEAVHYWKSIGAPLVLKADGLAAGKGVYVCHTDAQVQEGIDALYAHSEERTVLIEECIEGVEASFIVATNGKDIIPLAPSHDYKRIFEGNRGPNTGGMGSLCPTSYVTDESISELTEQLIRPVLVALAQRGIRYTGFLYAGLMISRSGEARVIEFNARLGDPETQTILRQMDSDLFDLLFALSNDETSPPTPVWKKGVTVCVVLASEGYPERSSQGEVITGVDLAEMISGVKIFHAGTQRGTKGELITHGGRVLNITASEAVLEQALLKAYQACDMIQFRGRQLRRDIGTDNSQRAEG